MTKQIHLTLWKQWLSLVLILKKVWRSLFLVPLLRCTWCGNVGCQEVFLHYIYIYYIYIYIIYIYIIYIYIYINFVGLYLKMPNYNFFEKTFFYLKPVIFRWYLYKTYLGYTRPQDITGPNHHPPFIYKTTIMRQLISCSVCMKHLGEIKSIIQSTWGVRQLTGLTDLWESDDIV